MIARLYYVRCNGCGVPCGGTNDLRESGTEARKVARRKGWRRTPRRTAIEGGSPGADHCPACVAKGM